MGTSVQPRQPGDDLGAVHVGQAEVEDDGVGRVGGRLLEGLGAVGREVDVVVPGAQVDAEGPQQLGFVVDDEHAGHDAAWLRSRRPGEAGEESAAGNETTMVSPPPGVSSGSRVPPMASTSPRDSASPRPIPVVLSVSPRRWKGRKTRSWSPGGMPGPRSMILISTRSPSRLLLRCGGVSGGAYRSAFAATLASTRSSSPGSAWTRTGSSGRSTTMRTPSAPRSSRAREMTSSTAVGCRSIDMAPACSRLMSSRLSTSAANRSSEVSAASSSSWRSSASRRMSRLSRLETAALAAASGVRKS